MRRVFAEIELGITRFRQEEHAAHEQRYCGFTGDAGTGFGPPHGASAVRGAAADRGRGAGGIRESTQSWREVLLAMKHRGFTRPAKLAVGDGALGLWAALSEVFPSTRTQRCWMHKTGSVLNYLPKSGQAKAKQGLHEIRMAEDPGEGRARLRPVARALRRQVPQGHRLPGPRPRRAARVLRLPRRSLGAPSNHQRHRVGLRHDPPSKFASQRLRPSTQHALDDLQDGSVRGEILAPAAWLPPPREGHRGSPVQRWHRGHRGQQSRRMNNPRTPDLTIALDRLLA